MMAARQWIFVFDDAGHPVETPHAQIEEACAVLDIVPNCADNQVDTGWISQTCDYDITRKYFCCLSAARPEGLLTMEQAYWNPCPPHHAFIWREPVDMAVFGAGLAVLTAIAIIIILARITGTTFRGRN